MCFDFIFGRSRLRPAAVQTPPLPALPAAPTAADFATPPSFFTHRSAAPTAADFTTTPPLFTRRPDAAGRDDKHGSVRIHVRANLSPRMLLPPLSAIAQAEIERLRQAFNKLPQDHQKKIALSDYVANLVGYGEGIYDPQLLHLVQMLGCSDMPMWALQALIKGMTLGISTEMSPFGERPATHTVRLWVNTLIDCKIHPALSQVELEELLASLPDAGEPFSWAHEPFGTLVTLLAERLGPKARTMLGKALARLIQGSYFDESRARSLMLCWPAAQAPIFGEVCENMLRCLLAGESRLAAPSSQDKEGQEDQALEAQVSTYAQIVERTPLLLQQSDLQHQRILSASHAMILRWARSEHRTQSVRTAQALTGWRPDFDLHGSGSVRKELFPPTLDAAFALAGLERAEAAISSMVDSPDYREPLGALIALAQKLVEPNPAADSEAGTTSYAALLRRLDEVGARLLPSALHRIYEELSWQMFFKLPVQGDQESPDRRAWDDNMIHMLAALPARHCANAVMGFLTSPLRGDILNVPAVAMLDDALERSLCGAQGLDSLRTPQLAVLACALVQAKMASNPRYQALDAIPHLARIIELSPKLKTTQLLALVFGALSALGAARTGNPSGASVDGLQQLQEALRKELSTWTQTRDADQAPIQDTLDRAFDLARHPLRLIDTSLTSDAAPWGLSQQEVFDVLFVAYAQHGATEGSRPGEREDRVAHALETIARLKDCPSQLRHRLVLAVVQDSTLTLPPPQFRQVHAAVLALYDTLPGMPGDAPATDGQYVLSDAAPTVHAQPPLKLDTADLMAFYDSLFIQMGLQTAQATPPGSKPAQSLINTWTQGVALLTLCLDDLQARFATRDPRFHQALSGRVTDARERLQRALHNATTAKRAEPGAPAPTSRIVPEGKHTQAAQDSALSVIRQLPAPAAQARDALRQATADLEATLRRPDGRQAVLAQLALAAPSRSPIQQLLTLQAVAPALAQAQDPATASRQLYEALAGSATTVEASSVVVRELVRLLKPLPGGAGVPDALRTAIGASDASAARSQALMAAVDAADEMDD